MIPPDFNSSQKEVTGAVHYSQNLEIRSKNILPLKLKVTRKSDMKFKRLPCRNLPRFLPIYEKIFNIVADTSRLLPKLPEGPRVLP